MANSYIQYMHTSHIYSVYMYTLLILIGTLVNHAFIQSVQCSIQNWNYRSIINVYIKRQNVEKTCNLSDFDCSSWWFKEFRTANLLKQKKKSSENMFSGQNCFFERGLRSIARLVGAQRKSTLNQITILYNYTTHKIVSESTRL